MLLLILKDVERVEKMLNPWTSPFVFRGPIDFIIKFIILVGVIYISVKFYRILKERNQYLLQIRDEIREIQQKLK